MIGLSRLGEIELDPRAEGVLERLGRTRLGGPAWKARKLAEARDLLALAQVSTRISILGLDLATDLQAWISMRVPVPRAPDASGRAAVAAQAEIALDVPEEALARPLPGARFVRLLAPRDVFHPNVYPGPFQALCLGVALVPGTPCREILCAVYGALSFQNHQLDERSPGGVLNPAAAVWWREPSNLARIPLTREPFLAREASR